MKDDIISFETAILAKEKGFKEPCNKYYIDNRLRGSIYAVCNGHKAISAPTQSLLQKWLRETHDIFMGFTFSVPLAYNYGLFLKGKHMDYRGNFGTYQEALEHALKAGLNLIE